jgi:hypothetical protein
MTLALHQARAERRERAVAGAAVDPVGRQSDGQISRFAVGVALPLAVVALAYTLWWISDRLLYIGPLDRAAFGWAVVVPIWVSVPITAGFAWLPLTRSGAVLAATVVGSTVGIVAAVLFWQGVAFPDCGSGAVRTPMDWVIPSMLVGFMVGAGLAASGLLASMLVRDGHPWRAFILGAGTELVLMFVAVLVVALVVMGPGCQRPSI